jgi:hypothetical protein
MSASSTSCCIGTAQAELSNRQTMSAAEFLVQIVVLIPLTSKFAFVGYDKELTYRPATDRVAQKERKNWYKGKQEQR